MTGISNSKSVISTIAVPIAEMVVLSTSPGRSKHTRAIETRHSALTYCFESSGLGKAEDVSVNPSGMGAFKVLDDIPNRRNVSLHVTLIATGNATDSKVLISFGKSDPRRL